MIGKILEEISFLLMQISHFVMLLRKTWVVKFLKKFPRRHDMPPRQLTRYIATNFLWNINIYFILCNFSIKKNIITTAVCETSVVLFRL